MIYEHTGDLVLAIYPATRGIAFALMRSPLAVIDWGIKGAYGRDKNAMFLKKVAGLLDANQPDVVVLEDPTRQGCVALLASAGSLARSKGWLRIKWLTSTGIPEPRCRSVLASLALVPGTR